MFHSCGVCIFGTSPKCILQALFEHVTVPQYVFAGDPQNGHGRSSNNEMQGTVAPLLVVSLFIGSFPGQLPLISRVGTCNFTQ